MSIKRFSKLFGAAIVATVVAVGMVGCGNDDDNNGNPSDSNNNTFTCSSTYPNAGWPNNSILASVGMSGMNAPTGATNICYTTTTSMISVEAYVYIAFACSSASDNSVISWFTNNGWAQSIGDGTSNIVRAYFKTGYMAQYFRNNNGLCGIGASSDR